MTIFKLFCVGFLVSFVCAYGDALKPIRIGIAPHSSPRLIFESHQDLKKYLEAAFQRPVQLLTAKTFSEFAKQCNEGTKYDLILTSPNLAYLAQHVADYTPVMTYTKGLEVMILGSSASILQSGRKPLKIAGQDPVSFITLLGEEWFEEQGLKEGEAIAYHYYISASDSLAMLLLNHEVDLIMISLPNYLRLSDALKSTLPVIYHSTPKPSRIFMVHASSEISLEKWQEVLKDFSKSKDGEDHLKIIQLEGYQMLDINALDSMKRLGEKTSKRLEMGN